MNGWASLDYAAAFEQADESTQRVMAEVWNARGAEARRLQGQTRNGLKAIEAKRELSRRPDDAELLRQIDALRAAWPGDAESFWQRAADDCTAKGWPVAPSYLRNLISHLRSKLAAPTT